MTRIISVVSGKGGAGKTTLVANLGAALAELGKDVTIIDANLTTPNLGFHLGVPLYPTTLHDVLKGKARIQDALYKHDSGVKIIPAGIGVDDLKGIDARDLPNSLLDLLGTTDIILIDAAAGLGREALSAIESSDEILLVTNPELPAVADALKAMKLAQEVGTKVSGVVLNRVTGQGHEMSVDDIKAMLEADVLAAVPEDDSVKKAIAMKTPVVHYNPNSKASREIRKLATQIAGLQEEVKSEPWYTRLLNFLFKS